MRINTRRTRIALGIAAVATALFAFAENLRLRTGEWDFTMTGLDSAFAGGGNVPPQARAQLAQPQHYKSCITDEDLAQLRLGPPDDEEESCKVTASTVTPQSADVTRTCTGEMARTIKLHVDAPSTETMKATIDMTSARGSAHLTIAGKWIGAKCTDDD